MSYTYYLIRKDSEKVLTPGPCSLFTHIFPMFLMMLLFTLSVVTWYLEGKMSSYNVSTRNKERLKINELIN